MLSCTRSVVSTADRSSHEDLLSLLMTKQQFEKLLKVEFSNRISIEGRKKSVKLYLGHLLKTIVSEDSDNLLLGKVTFHSCVEIKEGLSELICELSRLQVV